MELIQVETKDDLILSGLYNHSKDSKLAAIQIHGFTGDFYTHKFIKQIQNTLYDKNISSVSIQTRGTGIQTEIIKKGREKERWIGSFYEKLEEAHLDISAWVKYLLDQGNEDIILIGHSLGTIKAVRYLFEGEYSDKIAKLILLAPFDKNGYMVRHSGDKLKPHIDFASKMVKEGRGEEIIPEDYEDFALSYQTFLSWYKDTDLSNMFDFYRYGRYDFPILGKINIPVQVNVGDKDEFFFIPEISSIEDAKKSLAENIKDLDLNIIEGAEHCYVGFEDELMGNISRFV